MFDSQQALVVGSKLISAEHTGTITTVPARNSLGHVTPYRGALLFVRWNMRALIFLASLLIAGPVLAQPVLLVEFQNTMMICGDCQPIDMRIFSGAGTLGGGAEWSLPITASDVSKTFVMPSDVLDNFATALTSPALFGLGFQLRSIGPGGPELSGEVPSGVLTNGSLSNNPQVIRHVPALGPNLVGYKISNITQTLNSLQIVQQSATRFRLDANSTFHIYGAAIPEPSTLLLLVFAHSALRVRLSRVKFGPRA